MPLRNSEYVNRIKDCLKSHPRGLTIKEISDITCLNRNLVAKYLNLLQVSGIVEMETYGVAKGYFLSHRVPISAILDFSSDYIISFDHALRVCQINNHFLNLINGKREDLTGKYLHEIHYPLINEFQEMELSEIMNGNEMKRQEININLNNKRACFRIKYIPCVFNDGTRGITCVIEDITTGKIYEEERENYISQIEFFSKKIQDFIELPPDADMHMAIGAGLSEIVLDTIIDINAYNPQTKTLIPKAIYGKRAKKFFERCSKAGFSLDDAPINNIIIDILKEGKIFHMPGKVHYASFKQISEEESKEIEIDFNLSDFYSIGLTWRGNLLGNITLIMQNNAPPINIPLIEIYAKAASIVLLQRHLFETERRRSDNS